MKKKVELPLIEPVYSTYHNQGVTTAIAKNNPSIRNWYLNYIMNLKCNRKFLSGYTTPNLTVARSSFLESDCLRLEVYNTRFLKGSIHALIRNMLDEGYYVFFTELDDYYISGKSWYHKRHFSHDGCICGYDQEKKTYSIYAYDSNWIYQRFETPQRAWGRARSAMNKKGRFGVIYAVQVIDAEVPFLYFPALHNISHYLDSTWDNYPLDGEGDVYGIIVHDYIALYLEKLQNNSIPYERMDSRIFRVIWEHKKIMLERILRLEDECGLSRDISLQYEKLVHLADRMRMMYATYHRKRNDKILSALRHDIIELRQKEGELLSELVERAKKEKSIKI